MSLKRKQTRSSQMHLCAFSLLFLLMFPISVFVFVLILNKSCNWLVDIDVEKWWSSPLYWAINMTVGVLCAFGMLFSIVGTLSYWWFMAVHNWEFFKLQEGDLGGYFFLIAVNHWHAFGDKNGPYLFTTIEEAEGFLRSHSVDGVLYEDSYNHQYKIDWDLNKA